MKLLTAALAGTALLALAAPVSAQAAPPSGQASQLVAAAMPPWMQDDGSSSNYPIPMPGDISGDRLNAQYRGGIPVPPGRGFPAPYELR